MKHRDKLQTLGRMQSVFAVGLVLAIGACSGDSDIKQESGLEGEDGGPEQDAAPPDSGPDDGPKKPDTGTTAGSGNCGGKTCKAPATCSREGTPHCACPDGYEDTKGDGSQCDDVDECDADEPPCDKNATCKNTEGSFECACKEPAYSGDGKQCECAEGFALKDGFCVAENGKKCGDDLDCESGACEGGICCAQSCDNPGTCQTTEGATCEDGKTCKYETAEDGATCDDSKACTTGSTCKAGECQVGTDPTDCDDKNPCTDDSCEEPAGCKNLNNTADCDDGNPCTLDDKCSVSVCQGASEKDCSDSDDDCNLGTCDRETGDCKATPRIASTPCSDSNSCTTVDMCVNGRCVGAGNACLANSISCTAGTPNRCTCMDGFVDDDGVCVPNDNECELASVCSPDANCFDPSSGSGDVMCTCKAGFTGNGTTCTRVDPCANNPCGAGRGTCTAGSGGTHTCSCSAGYKAIAGACVCDMGGTWAIRMSTELSWADVEGLDDGRDSVYTYMLERHTYDDAGKLKVEMMTCGTTSFDLCGVAIPPFLRAEAYSDYVPIGVWDEPSMPTYSYEMDLPNPLPGQQVRTPHFATVHGMTLTDPLGTWPARRQDVQGSSAFDGSAVNGASWIDHDNDNQPAITDYAVPPGGIVRDGEDPDPMQDFGVNSAVCPRGGQGARLAYGYWPGLPESGLTPVRITRIYQATRSIWGYDGELTSCNEYSGDMTGPDGGKPTMDARVVGCMRQNGNTETACATRTVETLDTEEQTQTIGDATFVAKRMTGAVTCAAVRAMNFD